jgi:SWI/SNF-related matrix-associated actin-dependent regulator of chromatin subfamily D
MTASPRSDEAEADVHSRIKAIQQNEIDQIRELGSFLDNELSYAEQYTQILRDVKDNWPGKCVLPSFFTLPNPD